MFIIWKEPNESGGYPPIQTWDSYPIPETHAVWSEILDDADFYAYNGFVILTIEQVEGVDTVTSYEPNVEAWEAWKASLPEEPVDPEEPTEDVNYDDLAAAILEGVNEV